MEYYLGTLSVAQAVKGISASRRNAASLLFDAELLYENERWARCVALSILAIEEAGKKSLIQFILLAENSQDLKKAWNGYRSHKEKNMHAIILDVAQKIAQVRSTPHIEDLREMFDHKAEHPKIIDSVKQISFYSDCFGKGHWSMPDNVIDESLAKIMIGTARVVASKEPGAMESQEELEIWFKHMKPVWHDKNSYNIKQAIINSYQEAKDVGVLCGKSTPEELFKFLF